MAESRTLFRVSAQVSADGLFNLLDRNLQPRIFLIGVPLHRHDGETGFYQEPEGRIPDPEALMQAVRGMVRKLKISSVPPEAATQVPQKEEARRKRLLRYQYYQRALEHVLNELQADSSWVTFCSMPVPEQEHLLFVVLQLKKEPYLVQYRLHKSILSDGQSISPSLVDATIKEFLVDCAKSLRELEAEPGSGLHLLDRDHYELLRSAGKRFVYGVAKGVYGLFEACNAISSIRYERTESIGGMVVARPTHPNIQMLLELESPIPLRDYRTVRKLLELTEQGVSLVTDVINVYGLGVTRGTYDSENEDLFSVCFTSYYTWYLEHAGHILLKASYGLPNLPKGTLERENFVASVRGIYPDMDPVSMERLWQLTLQAIRQLNGTIVVITEGAAEEAVRLSIQAFRLVPVQMTNEVLRMATSIDGAVILGPDGVCHAIGAILDGMASEKGEPSRGSRYNSALRYVETSPHACVAVVVSEDGMVDILAHPRREA